MIDCSEPIRIEDLASPIQAMWVRSERKLRAIEASFDFDTGAPVYTVNGQYRTRGWTDWTQGFQAGSLLLQFEATGEQEFFDLGRTATMVRMHPHVTHFGVHDHGFTIVSTFGALLRLMDEGVIPANSWERACYQNAILNSGAVQANRWTDLGGGTGFIHSFNGPHSLFADTIRSLRSLALAHWLGGELVGEQDAHTSLMDRLMAHAKTTAETIVYYGDGRDGYDVRGRVAHEAIFNVQSGTYRCPSTQQGYAPVSTWTRGLAWIMCGYAELVEFLQSLPDGPAPDRIERDLMRPLRAACDYYVASTPSCGVPYWDTGAPGLSGLGDYTCQPADPFNDFEPVDSSAAAIAAQGLIRLGNILGESGARYTQAGLKVTRTLLTDPYLSRDPSHQGLLLHAVYHWPRRWDHVPDGRKVAAGESVMWGDYHLRELALLIQRQIEGRPYLRFCNVRPDRATP